MTQTTEQLDPQSLVARIISEIQANPVAQQMLLRALLTNEFMGMPARLDAIQADVAEIRRRVTTLDRDVSTLKSDVATLKSDVTTLKSDVTTLKSDVTTLKSDVKTLKSDVATLKGDSLEVKIPRSIRPYLSQKLALRRPRIMQSAVTVEADRELRDAVYRAVDKNVITVDQEDRIAMTDLILRARRRDDGTATVWVAVEASNTINQSDIERARESADALQAVFDQRSIAVAMGYTIRDEDLRLADTVGVDVFIVE